MSEPHSIFPVFPGKVLTQAYLRRIEKLDQTDVEGVLIERSLFNDLVKVAEKAHNIQMADEPLRRRTITIEGGDGHFTCRMTHLTKEGEYFANVEGEGRSVLEAWLAATAAFENKLNEMIR